MDALSSTGHQEWVLPDYQGGGILNLTSSVLGAFGMEPDSPTLGAVPPAELSAYRNIVLMVLDGLGHEYLRGQPHSFLHGRVRTRLTSVFPSTTASAITTFMTGLAPRQHGLTGWFIFLKELGTVAAVLPFRPRHGGPSFTRQGIDPRAIFDWRPLTARLGVPSYVVSAAHISDSDYSRATGGPARRVSYETMGAFFDRIRETVARDGARKYIYAYWPQLDSEAHQFGIASRQVQEHFRALDAGLVELVESLRGSGTVILVCADHGHIDTAPERTLWLDAHPRLTDTLALPLCGEPRVAYCYVRSRRRRTFCDYVQGELAEQCVLYESQALIEEGWFGPGKAHPHLADRVGDYVLIMKNNRVIKDVVLGERPFEQRGVHGGLSAEEMYVPLAVLEA